MHQKVIKPVRELYNRSQKFQEKLPSLRLPILFSVLALLSQDKVNIFNDSLIDLIDYIKD